MQQSRPTFPYNSIECPEQRARLSRRKLLVSGAAVAVAGSVLGPASQPVALRRSSPAARPDDDRRQRLAAILRRHGPEFGNGR